MLLPILQTAENQGKIAGLPFIPSFNFVRAFTVDFRYLRILERFLTREISDILYTSQDT